MRNRLVILFFLAIPSLCTACSDGSTTDTQGNGSANGPTKKWVNSAANAQPGSYTPASNRAGDLPASDHPILRFEPAPEDSQIAVATKANGQLYETRIFKRHPQLVKVDSTSNGTKEKALTILLRNGEVKNVTTESIGELKQATTGQLLQLG